MGRRFPPPLYGLEQPERRCRLLVDLTCKAEQPLDRSSLAERARSQITKPDGDQYSRQYLRRILSTYIQLGVVRETEEGLSVYQFARDWRAGDIGFETFLWYCVKQRWALEGAFPEGIEGLYHVHHVVHRADSPLGHGGIRTRLADRYDYEFNEEGIRGFPDLLECMGAFKETSDGYVALAPDRFAERLRNADILWQFEQWLKQEGPSTTPPPDRVKRDLAKYYMYRESGGHGRHRNLLDTARRDYLDESVLTDTSEPRVKRAEQYVEQRRRRQELRNQICDRFDAFEPRDLAGLATDVLERLADADNEREAIRIKSGAGSGLSRTDVEGMAQTDRSPYSFPDEFSLYDWQQEAIDTWFTDENTPAEQGIAQVVTGAGKTVMALGVIRDWLDEHPDGVVTVVVPTKVLMHQWITELIETLGVPPSDVGWLGGGSKDGFEDGHRILVSIVNSAVKNHQLAASLEAHGVDDHLLIADECHRYTGETFSNVFNYQRSAALGLSATPLSNPGTDERTEEDELLLSELGDIYYQLSYDEGLARGLIPEFRINYVGFDLTEAERTAYDRLTDVVVDAVRDIERQYQDRLYELGGNFARKLKVIKESVDGATPAITDFFEATQERRELVADAVARQAVTLRLLGESVEAEKKAIVFQERIEQLERMVAPKETRGRNSRTGEVADTDSDRAQLYDEYPGLEAIDQRLEDLFFTAGYRPVMYHSGHRNEAWNNFAIEWFGDDGFANVMLSVKALVEGVDVPSADLGIVRVSSGSVRQRIQTLGRVLRTGDDPDRRSELYVLYARDTVDADIFDRYDWRTELARADVRHLTWETGDDAIEGELREATEEEIPDSPTVITIPSVDELERGDTYDGPNEGFEFSVNADGVPFKHTNDGRRIIEEEAYSDIASYVHREKGGGTVTINEANHAVTYLDEKLVFVGVVPDPNEINYGELLSDGLTDETNIGLDAWEN